MLTGSLDEVGATIVLAVIYLITVRFLDINEREPWWSLLLVFVLGGAAAGALRTLVSPLTLELDLVAGAAWRETAIFVAIAFAVWMLSEIGRMRGWSEVTDVVDGLVYGMAAGLGFAAGEALGRGIEPTTILDLTENSAATVLAKTALAGLAQGVFGAVIGAGFGIAAARRARPRWIWPLVALIAAIALHVAHHTLAYGNALGESSAVVRGWIALLVPLAFVVAFAIYELATERRVIARELADEVAGGYVTEGELQTLQSIWRRQIECAQSFLTGRFRRLRWISALHNRQVMLALAKSRAGRNSGARAQQQTQTEIDALRHSIRDLRSHLDDSSASGDANGAQS